MAPISLTCRGCASLFPNKTVALNTLNMGSAADSRMVTAATGEA